MNPKMLVADDDPAVVRLLAHRCALMGFDVETATNGIQALLKSNRNQPDILIIDVNMPEVDGLAVCSRLRETAKRPLHLIVVTGSRDLETVERCESVGASYTCKGPNFWIDLESVLAELFPGMAEKIRSSGAQSTGADVRLRPRVLLVDDDPDIQMHLSSRLRKCGVDMLYAPDAVQGYRIACKEELSAIVTDYYMPNGDALYLLSRLRVTPATENVPVIVLSGRKLGEITEQLLMREICGHPGAAHILKKEFDTEELFGALQKYCGFEPSAVARTR
jgi:CheY-like chemotaxis protein